MKNFRNYGTAFIAGFALCDWTNCMTFMNFIMKAFMVLTFYIVNEVYVEKEREAERKKVKDKLQIITLTEKDFEE